MKKSGSQFMSGAVLLSSVLVTIAAPVRAQVSTSADSAAVLLAAAETFEADGDWEIAEALYRFISEHFGGTPSATRARAMFDTLNRMGGQGSGSVELRVWATTFGLWLGIAIPGALSADEPEPYGVGLLLGGPVGLLGGGAITRSLDLTEGQARAITLGGTWGTWQGLGWAEVLDLGSDEDCFQPGFCYDSGPSSEARFGAMIIGGLSGIAAGALLSRKPISRGVATTVNFGALWGTWFGVAASILMDFDEGDQPLAGALIGGNAGLAATALLAPRWNITRNRARLISIAGVIGGLSGVGLDLLIQPEGEKTAIAIPLATSILGLAIGATSTMDDDPGLDSTDPSLSGALLRFDGEHFGVGLPTPSPTVVPLDLPSGLTIWKPAVSFTLFAAKF